MIISVMISGLPSNELVAGEKSNKQQLTASVTTAKTTLAHSAVVKARDQAYQVCRVKIGHFPSRIMTPNIYISPVVML